MNMFKKNGGFTLVELIVVIAILAILAGIAVPAYSGYINSAKEAGDQTQLAAVKTAVMAAYATEGTVTSITFTNADGVTAVYVDNTAATVATNDINEFYGADTADDLDLETGTGASWSADSGEWTITGGTGDTDSTTAPTVTE